MEIPEITQAPAMKPKTPERTMQRILHEQQQMKRVMSQDQQQMRQMLVEQQQMKRILMERNIAQVCRQHSFLFTSCHLKHGHI